MGVFAFRAPLLRVSLALVVTGSTAAFAEQFKVGDVDVTIHGAASVGAVVRTDNPDLQFTTIPNARTLGVSSAGNTRNSDDGELNFKKGSPVSTALQGWVALEAAYDGFGFFVRGKGWRDFTLADQSVPWGNYPNGYVPNTPLSDAGFADRSKFSGAALQEAYVFGHVALGDHPLEFKVGNQLISWGLRSSFAGGLSALNPIDGPATHRAGATAEETRIPFSAASARFAVTPKLSLEGFWQFGAARNAYDGCGTFYPSDYYAQGCNYVIVGAPFIVTDQVALSAGDWITRGETPKNNELGQGGIGARHALDGLRSEVGLFYAHYNARNALPEISRTFRPSAAKPFIPGNPDGGNPLYRTVYAPDIDMLGATWQTRLATKTTLSAEYVYRPNYALGFPAGEELTAAVSATAPSLWRQELNALAPGSFYTGYDRRQTGLLNLSVEQQFDHLLGAKLTSFSAEVGLRHVYDLPDPTVRRYLRADTFGTGPVNGYCPPPSPSVLYTGCTLDGFVSKNAWGFRLRGALTYAVRRVADLDVTLSASYGKDVSGWSYDGTFNEGRNIASIALRAEYLKSYYAEVAYLPIWGGAFNVLRDRSVFAASMGARF
ncbi:hypothetical protein AC629_06975 [Bradyrhizobium sp. NAS80.1]|uniref:DUF1302 domain-containing protein n=1 Tax=Bradyrhizobium sp. NAS80.1 TaxID=1680159 RepID=UPI0009663AB1|nr:DUF1302 family protein [Bradyrhizobium sp. NAS80.1]OKO89256.1 hypothetical protein AC629_06975 [Bradyrhizobium sp. NAS80.1]